MSRVHVNNYSSTINGAINNSVTTIVVTSATGLPTLSGSDFYHLTLVSGATVEIVKVTARTGTSLTVVRAQESTSAVSWADGSIISLRGTANSFDRKVEIPTSVTANKILKSDGTVYTSSTETYAAPGTSGNVMTSDGTNWTSAAPTAGGASVSSIFFLMGA